MSLPMGLVPLIRFLVLATTTVFSIIVLGISASSISQTEQYYHATLTLSGLSIAVGIISFLTLPVLLLVDIFRRGAFTSKIVVELSWLAILTVLWVATAGTVVSGYNLSFPYGCDASASTVYNALCHQTEAVEAFAWLNFIILLAYTVFLCVMSIIAASRGNSGVWFSSVKEAFNVPVGPTQHAMTEYSTSVASPAPPAQGVPQPYVQPQYTSVPTQSPVTGQAIPV